MTVERQIYVIPKHRSYSMTHPVESESFGFATLDYSAAAVFVPFYLSCRLPLVLPFPFSFSFSFFLFLFRFSVFPPESLRRRKDDSLAVGNVPHTAREAVPLSVGCDLVESQPG